MREALGKKSKERHASFMAEHIAYCMTGTDRILCSTVFVAVNRLIKELF